MSGDYNGDEKVRINRINVESITDNIKVAFEKLKIKLFFCLTVVFKATQLAIAQSLRRLKCCKAINIAAQFCLDMPRSRILSIRYR